VAKPKFLERDKVYPPIFCSASPPNSVVVRLTFKSSGIMGRGFKMFPPVQLCSPAQGPKFS